jgi:hypothetical protein
MLNNHIKLCQPIQHFILKTYTGSKSSVEVFLFFVFVFMLQIFLLVNEFQVMDNHVVD